MKTSGIIKFFAYALLLILPILITCSVAYMFGISVNEEMLEAEDLYSTQSLRNMYLSELYGVTADINNVIEEKQLENDYIKYTFFRSNGDLLDCVILDKTNKKIYTNIEVINEDYTLEKLDSLFVNEENKYFIYDNGDITSNIGSLKNDKYNSSYYESIISSIYESGYAVEDLYINEGYSSDEIIVEKFLETDLALDEEVNNSIENNSVENKKEYLENSDIVIYSKISEEITFDFYLLSIFFDFAQTFGSSPAVFVPILFCIFIACVVYVISVAGQKKNAEGICLNSFDRIPFDILSLFYLVIVFDLCMLIYALARELNMNQILFYTFIMTAVMIYIVLYLVVMSWLITFVKRIKSKTFIKNNLIVFCITKIYKCVRWIFKMFFGMISKMWKAFKNFNSNLYKYFGLNFRILMFIFGFTILNTILIVNALDDTIFIFPLIFLWGFVIYLVVKRIARFKEIKKSLELIYNGDTNINLDEALFSGELKEMSHYINDISGGFSNAIEQGVKSERMKAELITNVSHDIKTPLTSIINYVDLLKKEEIQNEKAKEYIEILDAKSQRLKRLTEDLVEASKASSGNLKLNITKINLEELLSQSIGEFKDKFDEKKLEIVYNVKKEKIKKVDRINQIEKLENLHNIGKISDINKAENMCISADSRYMYRIIENLFSNIYKYALENSRVYIDLESSEGIAKVSIKNISRDKLNISQEELMQRFVRGDKSRTTDGSGLGISIAKSLTELQKGTFNLVIDGDLFKVKLEFKLR